MSGKSPIGVSIEELVERYPKLWHMAEAGSWPSIQTHGLRSTSALLDLFGYRGAKRTAIESSRRNQSVEIVHSDLGSAVIRDNKPINETVLARTLDGFTPAQWYELLNGKVFFWVSEERLDRLRNAGAYRERKHLILTVDSERLLERHADRVTLSNLNSGAVHAGAKYRRGVGTFEPMDRYHWTERLRTHPREPVIELAVEYSVPDIAELVLEYEER